MVISLCSISYEPSYLPFLFPGLSTTSMNTIPTTDTKAEPDDWHGSNNTFDEAAETKCRGRCKFGKHGKESVEACDECFVTQPTACL